LIEQDPQTGRYALGPAALQPGLTCLQQLDPIRAALPVARDLGQKEALEVARGAPPGDAVEPAPGTGE
jgi:DNA-binding IclR family transcriptional regulator